MSYCGDDVGALVADVGSAYARFGYAGEDVPKVVLESAVGWVGEDSGRKPILGTGATCRATPGMNVVRPVYDGIVRDWESLEELWKYGVADQLRADMRLMPTVVVEQPRVPLPQREKVAEVMFETFRVPALYLARAPVLSAFSVGRATALVIDVGAASTRVSPVYDGYVLGKAVRSTVIGTDALTEELRRNIESGEGVTPAQPSDADGGAAAAAGGAGSGTAEPQPKKVRDGTTIRMRHEFTRKRSADGEWIVKPREVEGITASYADMQRQFVLRDVFSTVCAVKPRKGTPPERPTKFELPDGTKLKLPDEGLDVPELLFDVSRVHKDARPALQRRASETPWATMSALPALAYDALLACDADVRREMCQNVVITGGGSTLPGLKERLYSELCAQIPSAFRVNVLAPGAMLQRSAPWTGGSILASLGSFQQLWVSAKEYEEEGAGLVERRCP